MKTLLVLVCVFLLPWMVSAGDMAQRQLAEEIMDVQELPQQVADLQARFTQAALGDVEGTAFDDEQKVLAKEVRRVILEELANKIDWASIKSDIVDIYVSEYTEAELRHIRDFLVSPAGKKYRDKIPLIKDQINARARDRVLKAMPEILIRTSKRLLENSKK